MLLIADLCTHMPVGLVSETIMLVIRDVGSGLLWAFPLHDKRPW